MGRGSEHQRAKARANELGWPVAAGKRAIGERSVRTFAYPDSWVGPGGGLTDEADKKQRVFLSLRFSRPA